MNPLCHLLALSAYVPDAVLTNQDLAKVVDTNEEWIVTRTGIKQRHRLADDENASDLGLKAARKALADIDTAVDIVNLFRAPQHCPAHAAEALDLASRPACFWMQTGIASPQARELLSPSGISVVEDRCIMVEYRRLWG